MKVVKSKHSCVVVRFDNLSKVVKSLRLYHLLRRTVRCRFQCVVQYACGVQQLTVNTDCVVAFCKRTRLCEYHAARFVEDTQRCISSLWEVEADERFRYEWVWLVLVQFEANARDCARAVVVETQRYIHAVVR